MTSTLHCAVKLQNCSSIGEYMRANMRFACAQLHPEEFSFMLHEQRSLYAATEPPVAVSNAFLQDTTVSPGCTIEDGANLTQCVLGTGAYVGRGVRLCCAVVHGSSKPHGPGKSRNEDSATGPSQGIGAGSTLKNVIVGHDASIGKNVVLVNHRCIRSLDAWDKGFVVRDGVTVVLKGAKIPDGFEF
jgi:glucose-1-phosphate adenylyltransferase